MHLVRLAAIALIAGLLSVPGLAQTPDGAEIGRIDVDFLLNYYDQDGDRSPVTGGIGTEELQVASPVFIFNWKKSERWSLRAELGVDSITSASTDNIDLNVSSASRVDARAYTSLTATRSFGTQDVGLTLGFSSEYDYQSVRAGLSWSRSFFQENLSIGTSVQHYQDTVELYDIDGVVQGEDDRSTTDVTVSLTQVLGPRTWASAELYLSDQSGFLSTPFHEVILAPTTTAPDGDRVAERLPDNRFRTALGLRLNHAFSKRFVLRAGYRFYDDDWDVAAHSIELEPQFRLSAKRDTWIYPILRFHTQESSRYYGAPRTFTGTESFFTADGDLGEFDSQKYGIGFRTKLNRQRGWLRFLRSFETRISTYSRDDGLDAISAAFAFGWSF